MDQQSDLEQQNTFLSSSIEATAAIVAIVFAISILVVQHAASSYTPTVLSNFKNDKKFWFTLTYSIFIIFFLSISLVFSWKTSLLNLFYFGNTLGLLAIFFLYTFEKINPISIVKDIENDIISECRKIPKKLKEKMEENSKLETSGRYEFAAKAVPTVALHSILANDPNLVSKIHMYELTLRQIILQSERKGDFDTSRASLYVYPTIFENYLKIIPDYEWPSDKFIEKILEDLKSYSNEGLQKNEKILLEDLFTTYKKSGEIFTNNIRAFETQFATNQPLHLCIYHLNEFAKKLLIKEEYDLSANAIRAMGELGNLSAKNFRHEHLVIDSITKLAMVSIQRRDFFIPNIVMHESFKIIRTLIKNLGEKYTIKESIELLAKMLEEFEKHRINDMSLMGGFTDITDNGVIPCVIECLQVKNGDYERFETRYREEFTKKTISNLIGLVGRLGRAAKESGQVVMASTCADCLTVIAGFIAPQEYKTIEQKHTEELRGIISILASLQDKENRTVLSSVKHRISEVIVNCYDNGYDEVAENGIDLMSIMSQNILKDDDSKYSALRILRSLDTVGCYGIASKHDEISIQIADKYLDFEELLGEKFGREMTDPSSDYGRYEIGEYDQFRSKYKTYDDLSQIVNPENGKEFEDIISKIRKIRKDAKRKIE
ncbi:DUF2254 family protein [Nitrosopumilus sp.]|uniref:DUF2254 family protein n=1 Tax=Nitrosopumilus sp. TaxID=2024843 RepID=UPI003D0C8C94